ncbi:GDSL-type esterase/lipase family protein [Aliifodinibius sp. S!AR15-10]|uniref:GDSL-type esterase/lipase family protein n=1 Tax=Aliifodinibius sp. S!AR15-10 TaxID=2950437 RepID=UPI00285C8A86|nr:GDSL-type esterase/lipase family protein [Aliifodinibius sp. S!AR15-10]MDR8390776.1 GDSL-type esterase/lipase family protein [Aliifodinibius sp. S!AR15-10]
MRFKYIGIIYAVVIVGIVAASSQAQSVEQKPDFGAYYYHKKSLFEALPNTSNEIILLGDSITDGNEWSELFGSSRLKNRGISGDVTEGILYRLSEVTESNPAQVFIMIGVNDLARGIPVDTVLSNYGKIIDQIREESPDTEIYIQSILPVNDEFPQFSSHTDKTSQIKQANVGLTELAKKTGATFINLFDDFSTAEAKLNPNYTEDGLHLNGQGYVVWKSVIGSYMDL